MEKNPGLAAGAFLWGRGCIQRCVRNLYEKNLFELFFYLFKKIFLSS